MLSSLCAVLFNGLTTGYIFRLAKMVIFVDNRGYEKLVCCMHEIEK
jgi:hypothetical protein